MSSTKSLHILRPYYKAIDSVPVPGVPWQIIIQIFRVFKKLHIGRLKFPSWTFTSGIMEPTFDISILSSPDNAFTLAIGSDSPFCHLPMKCAFQLVLCIRLWIALLLFVTLPTPNYR